MKRMWQVVVVARYKLFVRIVSEVCLRSRNGLRGSETQFTQNI